MEPFIDQDYRHRLSLHFCVRSTQLQDPFGGLTIQRDKDGSWVSPSCQPHRVISGRERKRGGGVVFHLLRSEGVEGGGGQRAGTGRTPDTMSFPKVGKAAKKSPIQDVTASSLTPSQTPVAAIPAQS